MSLFIPLINHKPSDPCDGRWRRRYLSQVKDLLQWGQGWSWEDVFMWCSNASGDEYLFWHLVHWKCLKCLEKWLFTLNFMPIRNTFIWNSFLFFIYQHQFFQLKMVSNVNFLKYECYIWTQLELTECSLVCLMIEYEEYNLYSLKFRNIFQSK